MKKAKVRVVGSRSYASREVAKLCGVAMFNLGRCWDKWAIDAVVQAVRVLNRRIDKIEARRRA